MSLGSEYASNITRLELQRGQTLAESKRRRGELIGNTLASLSQLPQVFQQQRLQEQQQAAQERERASQQKLRDVQTQEGEQRVAAGQDVLDTRKALDAAYQLYGDDPDSLITHLAQNGNGHLIPDVQKNLSAVNKARADAVKALADSDAAQQEYASRIGNKMQAFLDAGGSPEDAAGLGLVEIARGEKAGLIPKEHAEALANGFNPQNPDALKRTIAAMIGKPKEPPKTRTVRTTENGVEVEKIVPDIPGASYPVPPPKPASTPNVGSFEDYVTRTYGANPTPQQVIAARKAYNQADDRPRVDVNVNGGADRLTDDAIGDTAVRYRILGTSALPTRIEGPERVRIMNEAAKQQRALGQTAAQAVQKSAAFKSDAASLTQMQKMASSAEAFETKALAQADLIGDLSQKVSRTQYPLINSALLSGKQKVFGDQNTQLLFNALDTFTTEYAKIMAGATGSAGATSDAATRKAEGLISASLNKGTLQATLDQMKWEMNQTRKGYDATIAHITDRMGGGTPQSPNVTPTSHDPMGIR